MKITRFLKMTLGTALLAGTLMLAPKAAEARVFISVGFAPPAIPVYTQPICPGDGYIWTPGYWQYTDEGYQWVDGAWVLAPYPGALWTPGYWGYGGSGYFWNAGYWGPSVGYYGGINYGFGYFGVGFYGGYWNHGAFFYNREYNHFGAGGGFRNVYDRHVDGFDGRPGGASFARGVRDENRSRSFNGDVARNGFSQQQHSGSEMRSANTFNHGQQGFTGSYAGYRQPAQARPNANYNGGFRANSGARPAAPANNVRQPQGGTMRSNSGGRPAAPAFHGNPGGGSHGGGGHGGGHH